MPGRRGTLTTRLRTLLVGVILLTVVVVGAVLPAAFLIRDANDSLQHRWLPAADAARVLLASFVNQETGERGYIITTDRGFLQPYRTATNRTERQFTRLRTHAPASFRPTIDRLERQYRRWRVQSELEINAVVAGDASAARGLVASGAGRTYFDAIRRTQAELQDRIDTATARAERDVTAANRTLFVAIGLGAVGAIVFALLARRLLRRWVASVDDQQRAIVELGEQTRLVHGLTRQTPDPIFLKDADGRYRFVNEGAARTMGGGGVDAYVGRTDAEVFAAEQLPAIRRDDDAVRAAGGALDFEEAVGDRRLLVTKSPYVFGDGSVGVLGVARDITDRVQSEARIASLAVIGQAVGRQSTVVDVARAAVGPVRDATDADVVWIFRADGARTRLEPLVDDGTRTALRDQWQFVPVAGDTATARAFRAGELRRVARADVAPGSTGAGIFDSEDLELVVHVPLIAAGATIGIMNLGWRAARTLDDEATAFLRGLATVLAESIARAQATELERAAVATFQRALLPDDRFSPLLDVATRYEPALDDVTMGGDWFDVFDLGPDRLGIAVGDVVGSGIEAAAVMGRLRSALHAIAEVVDDPGAVLTYLDRFAGEIRDAAGTTVFFAVYDHVDHGLRYACAAHPPPVIRRATHVERLEGARGIPLGLGLGTGARESARTVLATGDLIVVYTDGLVERRDETIDVGIERLADATRTLDAQPIEEVADGLLALLDPSGRTDDTAVVCARVPSPDAPYRTFRIPAAPSELAVLRRSLRGWLAERGVDAAVVEEVLVAVTEAAGNSIEHGYGHDDTRTVVVEARIGTDLSLTVRDGGRWVGQLRRPERGRGVQLMRSLMSEVEVVTSDQGTIVRMRRSLEP